MHIKHLGVCVLGVLLALPVYSDKEVVVEVTAHVDPELNIERISTAGTINLFNHAAEEYRITNVGGKGENRSGDGHFGRRAALARKNIASRPSGISRIR